MCNINDLHYMMNVNLTIHLHSINLLTCQLSSNAANLVKAIQYVIKKANSTGRRSVIAAPLIAPSLIAPRSDDLNNAIEEAVKKNIVMVTSAGKK